jgi:hypothetical protein
MSGNAAAVLTKPAFRKIEWLKRDIAVEPDERHIPASLAKWANDASLPANDGDPDAVCEDVIILNP